MGLKNFFCLHCMDHSGAGLKKEYLMINTLKKVNSY